jgi:hypothetical protein
MRLWSMGVWLVAIIQTTDESRLTVRIFGISPRIEGLNGNSRNRRSK